MKKIHLITNNELPKEGFEALPVNSCDYIENAYYNSSVSEIYCPKGINFICLEKMNSFFSSLRELLAPRGLVSIGGIDAEMLLGSFAAKMHTEQVINDFLFKGDLTQWNSLPYYRSIKNSMINNGLLVIDTITDPLEARFLIKGQKT